MNYKINLQSSREKLLFTRLTIKRKNVFNNRISIYTPFLTKLNLFLFLSIFFLVIWQTHRKIQNPMKIPGELRTVRIQWEVNGRLFAILRKNFLQIHEIILRMAFMESMSRQRIQKIETNATISIGHIFVQRRISLCWTCNRMQDVRVTSS